MKIAMLGSGLIERFYATSLHAQRRKDSIYTVYPKVENNATQFTEDYQLPHCTRMEVLQQLNKEEQTNSNNKAHYFSMLKSLTINGYITSEKGATKAFRYDPVPGKCQGCIPYEKGDRP